MNDSAPVRQSQPDTQPGNGIMPIALLQDRTVNPTQLLVYVAMSTYHPGVATIAQVAELARLSEDATLNAWNALIAKGWATVAGVVL